MQQRKGNFKKANPRKANGFKNGLDKKGKENRWKDDTKVDLSSAGRPEREGTGAIDIKCEPRKYVFDETPKFPLMDVKCKLTGKVYVGFTEKDVDRGSVFIPKGQCVLVHETDITNTKFVVKICCADGRSAFEKKSNIRKHLFSLK